MMTGNGRTRLERAYERNLAWCRAWLGIGIVVATLTFTFVVEQRIFPLIEARSIDAEKQTVSAPDESAGKSQSSEPVNPSNVGRTVLSGALVLAAGFCIVVAWRFRELYKRNDLELATLQHPHQEDTR